MGDPVYCVGYCNIQNLLRFTDPFAYSARAEGWACDYYYIHDVIISTGYAPIGRKTDYKLCREYDEKAAAILRDYTLSVDDMQNGVAALLEEFVEKLTA